MRIEFEARVWSVAVVLGLSFGASSAQVGGSFDLSWHTMNGGGSSARGNFAANGTFGQAATATMSGGSFTVSGGFWSFLTSGPAARRTLVHIRQAGAGRLIVSWPASDTGWVLQQATVLASSPELTVWTDVTSPIVVVDGANTVTLTPGAGSVYFRLRQQ
jgi:hypothetical protein